MSQSSSRTRGAAALPKKSQSRKEKLAAALRENLKRRKAQARQQARASKKPIPESQVDK